MSTFACPATREPGAFDSPTEGTMAASSCSSPSSSRLGSSSWAISTARTTLFASSFRAEPFEEWESIATAGSVPMSDFHERAEFTAIWASASSSGCTSRPQSLKMNVPFWPYSQSGTTITKNELASFTPGAVFKICRQGRNTSPVEWQAPDTMPSASPHFTIMTPKYRTSEILASASSGVIPLCLRSS